MRLLRLLLSEYLRCAAEDGGTWDDSREPLSDPNTLALGPRIVPLSEEEKDVLRSGDASWPMHWNYLSSYLDE